MGRLPEQTQANLSTLGGLRQQLEANATSLRAEQDRLSMIERQLDAMKQGNSDGALMARGGLPSESRVMALERQLAETRANYTEKHPEVQRLKEELESAKRDAAADHAKPSSDRLAQLQLDPSYRQLMTDREMARLRIKELERSGSDAQRQISMYQARVEAAPMVEQQLSTVQRDYDLEKSCTRICPRSSTTRRSPKPLSGPAAASSSWCSTPRATPRNRPSQCPRACC